MHSLQKRNRCIDASYKQEKLLVILLAWRFSTCSPLFEVWREEFCFCPEFFASFGSDSFFWMALDQYWTRAAPWQLYNGAWYPTVTECRPQQLLLHLLSSTTTAFSFTRYNNSDLAFLLGLCFSESGKLVNLDTSLTLPCWLSAAILLKSYWRHRPMDKSGININSFSFRVRLKCLCNHKHVAKLLYRLTKMK